MIPSHSLHVARMRHVLNRVRNKFKLDVYVPPASAEFKVTDYFVYISTSHHEAVGILRDNRIMFLASSGGGLGADVVSLLERKAARRGLGTVYLDYFYHPKLHDFYCNLGYSTYRIEPFVEGYGVDLAHKPNVYFARKDIL